MGGVGGGGGGRTFKGSERCGSFISTLLAAQSGLSPGLRLLFRVASLSFTTRSSRCWELAVGISTGAVEVQDFENHLFHLGSRRLTTLRTFDRRDPCGHMLLWIRQSQKWTDLSLHHRKNVSTETFLESPEIRRHRADGGRAPGHSGDRAAVGVRAIVPAALQRFLALITASAWPTCQPPFTRFSTTLCWRLNSAFSSRGRGRAYFLSPGGEVGTTAVLWHFSRCPRCRL